jgi:sec-independent protein translocase protein TatA
MGFRHFGSLLIIFLILMMVFGTQRLREIGNDLAIAIRSFRKGLQEEPDDQNSKEGKDSKESKEGKESKDNIESKEGTSQ